MSAIAFTNAAQIVFYGTTLTLSNDSFTTYNIGANGSYELAYDEPELVPWGELTVAPTAAAPEPPSVILLMAGLLGLVIFTTQRKIRSVAS
jgi:hypothetical protein